MLIHNLSETNIQLCGRVLGITWQRLGQFRSVVTCELIVKKRNADFITWNVDSTIKLANFETDNCVSCFQTRYLIQFKSCSPTEFQIVGGAWTGRERHRRWHCQLWDGRRRWHLHALLDWHHNWSSQCKSHSFILQCFVFRLEVFSFI